MRIALLSCDDREPRKRYDLSQPIVPTPQKALLDGWKNKAGVEVHMVSCLQRPARSPEKLAENIWYHGLLVPKIGWLRTGYQGCIRAVRRKLQEVKPDIVHGQGTERDQALCAVLSGFPNVITIHGNMRLLARVNHARPLSYQWLAARLEQFTIPRSHGIVCISQYTRDAVAGLAQRTWVVPNAVDAGLFEIETEPQQEGVPVVLCLGHVMFRKNQNAFIRALDPLVVQHKFKLVFIGRAEKGRQYEDEFFQLLEARPWCSYEGFADREKLKTYLQSASMLALPSLEENCPMAVLEAMAAGVPVLAAQVGGVPDLIEAGVTGLFCNPLDETSIRKGMATLLENPNLRRELAVAAKRRAKERFHPVSVAQQHLEIYREVLNTRS